MTDNYCPTCNGYDPHGEHPADCYYQEQAREERRARRREKRARFGDPVGGTADADRVENLRPSVDVDGKKLGMEGDCPACGKRTGLSRAELKGRREAFCLRCGWAGRHDYSQEMEAVA